MLTRSEFLKISASALAGTFLLPESLRACFADEAITKSMFGNNFSWGVATGAYQLEGGWNADGKGLSIWDEFTHRNGKIRDGNTGDVSCDFYNKYDEDLRLLKSLNFDAFRFSTAWARIYPNGIGTINEKGVDFYNRVIDTCLENSITPWINLYHWDLPLELEKKGGWANRDVINWFGEYAQTCTLKFGDRVKNWLIINEPLTFTSVGYFLGIHAPGYHSLNKFLAAVHHVALCQAEGGRIVKQNVAGANVGTTFSCSYIDPKKAKPRFYRASKRLDALMNRLFIEPALGMGYPTDTLPFLHRMEKYILPGDMEKLAFNFDFIGLQNYFRVIGKPSLIPFVWANRDNPDEDEALLTEMGWEVYPEGIYKVIKRFSEYPIKEFVISENGAAFPDKLVNGKVEDCQRVDYYKQYLKNVLKAKNEGINITGYFAWTFLDNFEWAEGFRPRFGIVYTDFATQQRIVKSSGLWFKEFLK